MLWMKSTINFSSATVTKSIINTLKVIRIKHINQFCISAKTSINKQLASELLKRADLF